MISSKFVSGQSSLYVPCQYTFNAVEEPHNDFRDRLPDVDPNDVMQLQATNQVEHDNHGFALLDRQKCYKA